MLYIFVAFAILGAIIAFFVDLVRKWRMEKALGREVRDDELTSLNSWIEVVEIENQTK